MTIATRKGADPDGAIRSWKTRIARRAASPERWSARTTQLIELARDNHVADLYEHVGDFAFWLSFTTHHPDVVNASLLSQFMEQFARLVTNLGRGQDNTGTVLWALDGAITLQNRVGAPATGLYLAKAAYLRAEYAESDTRLAALRAAADSTRPGSEAWAATMIARCWYELDVSHYRQAIRIARRLRDQMPTARFGGRYDCAALAWEGVALFTSFQDLSRAQRRLHDACRYEDRVNADPQIGQWVAMAYHYLARIAELRQRYRTSLAMYLKGQQVAALSRESLHADTFEHLRIAELLMAAGLFKAAQDHLDQSYALVRTFSDRSAARLQVDLGYATLEAAAGDPRHAMRSIEQIQRRARSIGFWRGELLCQGYLLALAIRLHAYWRLPVLGFRILASALLGELRRNSLPRLLARIPVMLPIAIRRMSRRRASHNHDHERIIGCPCDLHLETR